MILDSDYRYREKFILNSNNYFFSITTTSSTAPYTLTRTGIDIVLRKDTGILDFASASFPDWTSSDPGFKRF